MQPAVEAVDAYVALAIACSLPKQPPLPTAAGGPPRAN